MTRKARFTQADIVRAIKGFQDAGHEVGALRLTTNGTITIIRREHETKSDDNDWFKGGPLYAERE